jgi:DNA-binding transcriptional ArsR family regulator
MVKRNQEELAAFRAGAVALDPVSEYAEGYRDALLDVVAAFSAGWHAIAARWPIGWEDVFDCLARGPQCPTEVAAATGTHISTASRRLAAMAHHGLVEVLDAQDGRSKLYRRRG